MARFRSRGRRMMRSGRRSYRRFNRRAGGNGMLMYGLGGVAGYMAPRLHPMQDVAITALAVLPVRLPFGLKKISQGYVLGMLIKGFIPAPNLIGTSSQMNDGVIV